MITEMHPLATRPIQDTPCARCGHGNAHGPEECREWMAAWSLTGARFWTCGCPEWIQPSRSFYELICWCGKRNARAWLNGAKGCSPEHALSHPPDTV